MGLTLGVLKAPLFSGSAFKTDFTSFPFVDLTGRHTVSTVGIVNQVSSKASFTTDGTVTNYLGVSPNADFDLRRDFDLVFKFTMSVINLTQTILAIREDTSPSSYIVIDYPSAINKLRAFIMEPSGTIVDVRSLSAMSSGVEYVVRLKKSGNNYKLFINNTYQGSVNAAQLGKIASRQLYLGGQVGTGYGLSGTMDDVDFKLLANLCYLDFEAFPFVDITGRHTISNFGVTQVSNAGYFNNPSNTSLARLETASSQDFNLQNDFDVSMTINIASFAGRTNQVLFSIEDGARTSVVDCYVSDEGRITIGFPALNTFYQTSTGVIAAATSYDIRIERRGASVQIWVDDVARTIAVPSLAPLPNVKRKIIIGALPRLNGYGLNGSIDNFSFDVC